ncbi:MAG: hypothetical protein M3P31_02270 [Actinomycetota bacterium]|nr:hypothetical protein [Actinomycetota bacterium]
MTGTAGSSARLYYETFSAGEPVLPTERVAVPTAVARFPREIYRPPRSWVEEGFDRHYRRKSSDSPTHSSGCTGQNGGSRRGCSPSPRRARC